ncbi:MAG TPA: ATP-binding cassette domain-containing protein [Bacillota bacterium]|nr:ATP-binding cassette domain-containing protein [Bacillota bacterium]
MQQKITGINPLISANNVGKVYPNGVKALEGLNLKIDKGEMVGILGASGSGKTTLFRLINGAIEPTSGQFQVLGVNSPGKSGAELRRLRTRVATIYQHHNIIPGLSVARNILMGRLGSMKLLQMLRLALRPEQAELAKVSGVLELLGLEDKIFDRATDLSGGQQQRVAIARALLSEAPVILADEPIASVDRQMAEVILNLFRDLNEQKQTTIIMNLHQEDFALNYCSRIIALQHGQLVYDGSPEGYQGKRRDHRAGEAV